MDSNISLQIKRLIEIDHKAVELAERREQELKNLEENHRDDLNKVNSMLQYAKEEAKRIYNEKLKMTQTEVEELSSRTDKRLNEIEQALFNTADEVAHSIWQKLLEGIK